MTDLVVFVLAAVGALCVASFAALAVGLAACFTRDWLQARIDAAVLVREVDEWRATR